MSPATQFSAARGQTRELLERGRELETLESCFEQVRTSSSGVVAFVGGEAGVGKTALLHELCEQLGGEVRVLGGACEPLVAPRPFGPFVDLAESIGGQLGELVANGAKPHAVATALLRDLEESDKPSLVVLEDLHWADEATRDVLRLSARRVSGISALIVGTYRNDELGAWHPLRAMIGELGASQRIVRVALSALSPEAVELLAAPFGVDAAAVYARTGGNPFFVTELLAGGGRVLPVSVSEAVLARAARISPSARGLLEAIAILGPQAELWLLERLAGQLQERLAECIESGMITSVDGQVAFRHELAREAVLSNVPEYDRLALHAAALAALSDPLWGEPDLARLAHHADGSHDPEAVLRFVPQAAARAAKLGAHREAAALYGRALDYAGSLPLERRAALLERRAAECYFFTDFESAEKTQREALACYQQLGAELRQAAAQSWLSNLAWQTGSLPDALPMALHAATRLDRLSATRERVTAYLQVAQLELAAEDPEAARGWAMRASELADQDGAPRLANSALMTRGWVEFFTGRQSGLDKLESSIEIGRAAGFEVDVGAAHVVVARTAARLRLYDLARRHVRAGLDYCEGRDIDIWRYYLIAWQSKLELARGRWEEAARLAEICLCEPCPFARIHALVALGLVRARRGDPDPWTPLDEALASALPRGEFQWIAPVAAARAEAAWLEGRDDAVGHEIEPALGFPMRHSDPYASALTYWQWRGGLDPERVPEPDQDPCRLEIAGDCDRASQRWRALGCPYEAALALAGSRDPGQLSEALSELQALGARPAVALVSRRLRERGIRSIPRGPRRRTRENPAGLTARELEVLVLMADGLRNAEIAQRLIVTKKTVDHHVSAVLRKLGVRTRGEASIEAVRLGLSDSTRPHRV